MAIETICSGCESRFTVQDDLQGRSMRCPDCKTVFVVKAVASKKASPLADPEKAPPAKKSGTSRTDAPTAKYKSGSVADFLEVLETEEEAASEVPAKPVVTEPPRVEEVPTTKAKTTTKTPVAKAPPVEEESFDDFEVVEDQPPKRTVEPKPSTKGDASKLGPAQTTKPIVLEVDEPGPTEVKWSADLTPPPPKRKTPSEEVKSEPEAEREDSDADFETDQPADEQDGESPRASRYEEEEEEEDREEDVGERRIQRRRRKKKKSRFVLMLFLFAVIVGSVGFGGFMLKRHMDGEPERLYQQAKKDYDAKNYEPARKVFEELAKDHPKHPRAAEAKFFIELCSLRMAVHSVTVRTDPAPAQAQLELFLKAMEQPGMQPFIEQGKFNVEVWQCIVKLDEDLVGKGTDVFVQESPDDSESWLRQAETVSANLERFRSKENPDREIVFAQMATLRKQIDGARARTRLLAEAKIRLVEADDKIIDEVRANAQSQTFYAAKEARDMPLAEDPAFKQLLADAEKKIQDRVIYKRLDQPIVQKPARGSSGTGLLFAPRVDAPDPNRLPLPLGPTSVFFAIARGVLYALEDGDGKVLWATRVGIDGDSLPLQLPANDLHPELVLVVSNDGVQAGLTARLARTGEAFWHQALPSPVIGRPLLVGQRIFVPLSENLKPDAENPNRTELGVVLEIEIASGSILGKIVLGRPLGGNAARRPATGQLFFPAEAKGVYVFDVEKIGADGSRLDPTFLGILPTGHAAGTLRGDPVITTGEGDTPSYLVLSITDGLETMKLRAFPLSPADQAPAIHGEVPPPIALSGWSWFPPYCDTEKLAVVTDRGEFGLFGIKQAGNLDIPLFVLPPTPYLVADVRLPARGQIVHADEHDFWFLARGLLYHLKIGFDAERGLRLVQRGTPIPIGEPLQPAQINARGDFALVVTQASSSASCRATAIDLRVGKVRWQRQLGLVSQGDPIRIGDSVVLMDHDGGLYKIDAGPLAKLTDESWLIEEKWLVAPPLADVPEAGQFLASIDGASAFVVVTTRGPQGSRLVVRRYVPGQPIEERSAALPSPIAGNAIAMGKQVIVPLANGLLYRMNLTTDRPLEAGPSWRGERISAQSVCLMTPIDDNDFLATDGSRTLNRWRWIGGQEDFSKRGGLTLADRIVVPPIVVADAGVSRVFVIDIRNNATLWDPERLVTNPMPLRSWQSGDKGVIPTGAISNGPYLERDAMGKSRIAFVLDKFTVVWLAPDAPAPLWIAKPQERVPGDAIVSRPSVGGGRMVLTHRAGKCIALDLANGEVRDELIRLKGSAVPGGAAILVNGLLLAPLSDGTVVLKSTLPHAKAPAAPPIFIFPLPPLGLPVPLPTP